MSDRKYSQRGYQDDERPRGEGRRGAPVRARDDGPRGRGLGTPTTPVFRCRDCGAEQPMTVEVAPEAVCAGCGAALHACVNCRHFDTAAPLECRQPIPARLPSKTRANACALFAEKITLESDGQGGVAADDPRAAFDALFK